MSKIRIRNAKRKFTVERDKNGVPHVNAPSWLDALYGLGYVHATDRGTQILFARAVASGRGAEQIADQPELVETDRFFRRVGLHLNLQPEVDALDDKTFGQLTSYCSGVNAGLNASRRSLPMWATGFQPQPWNHLAVLLVGKLLSFGGLAVSQLQNERLLVELIHAGTNEDALKELFSPHLDDVDFELVRQIVMPNQLSNDALELITDLPRLAGSNAWAVGPTRSATGHALIASDPHLEVNRLPAVWYEAVLRWDDKYVMGATLPGCPLFAVARTPRLAWGVTYMKGDTIDFFIEDCRQGSETLRDQLETSRSPWQFRRGDQWQDFQVREEHIARKGADDEILRVYENEQGTLDGDIDKDGPGYYLSTAWAGKHASAGRGVATWLEVIEADSVAEGMEVAKYCPQPTLCFMFADSQGNIGMQGCGHFPIRRRFHDGLVPLPAWDSENHWRGFLSKEFLPSIYNPPQGFVATANEAVNPPEGPWLVTQPVPDYRKRRIVECLQDIPAATIQDMQEIQYDFVSLQARDLLEIFLPYLDDGEFKSRLQAWDCRYDTNSHEASLFQHFYINVIIQVFGQDDAIGWRRVLYLCSRCGYSAMVLNAADQLLARKDSRWWQGRDKGELIRRAAEQTAAGPDTPWSAVNNFHFVDRFFGGHRVGRLLGFNSGSYAMPGCQATPFQGHVFQTATREQTFAPSYHFVADLGTDEAWTNLPGGPSESRFSKFYRSDIDRWLSGEYKRLSPFVLEG